jgi:hypothetical protein
MESATMMPAGENKEKLRPKLLLLHVNYGHVC